jgi:glycosyltransferase involved in cell wall biosynthesis
MPAYNEGKYIGTMVLDARQYADEIIVVDDGSRDATAKIASLAGAHVIRHEKNRGYGAAIRSLIAEARKRDPDMLVIIDADGQHDPGEIPLFSKSIEKGNDFVIGSRRQQKGRIPFYRRIGQGIILRTVSVLSKNKLSDSESGFRAFSRKALKAIDLKESGMAVSAETVAEAFKKGLKVAEVPITVTYNQDSSTLNPLAHGFGVLTRIMVMISERKPLFFFGLGGVVLMTIGLAAGIRVLQMFADSHILPVGTTIFTMIFLIIGAFSVFTGVILWVLSKRSFGTRK